VVGEMPACPERGGYCI